MKLPRISIRQKPAKTSQVRDSATASADPDALPDKSAEELAARPYELVSKFGEALLLIIAAGFFVYLFLDSLDWPFGAQMMPWITLSMGIPMLVARSIQAIREKGNPSGDIMDMGFGFGGEAQGQLIRFGRIAAFVALFYASIWLFGIRLALPLGVFIYLLKYGKIGIMWSAAIGLFFVGFIALVFDFLLFIPLPGSGLLRVLGLD